MRNKSRSLNRLTKVGVALSTALLTSCLMGNLPLYAQDETEDSYSYLETIVVSASRMEESVRGLSIKPQVISREAIELNQSINLTDVLADHGVQLTQSRGSIDQRKPSLRGFTNISSYGPDLNSNILILLNGRRSGMTNLLKFPSQNIERIEIIRGPAGVQYGSSAVAGVINIITRQGTPDTTGGVEMGAGSFGRYEASGDFALASDAVDFSMGASYATRNEDYKGGNGETVSNSALDFSRNVSTNLGYSFNETNRLGFMVHASDLKFDEPTGPGGSYDSWSKGYDYSVRDKNASVDFTYDGMSESGLLGWQARYYTSNDDYEQYRTEDTSIKGEWYDVDLRGFQMQANLDLSDYNTVITTGVDWYEYDVDSFAGGYVTDDLALFLMGRVSLLDERLFFNAGVRHTDVTTKSKDLDYDNNDKRFNPSFGAAFMLTDNLKLRANWSTGFLAPSGWRAVSDTGKVIPKPTNQTMGPNPDLKAEEFTTIEGGFDYSREALDFSFTYFHTDTKNRQQYTRDFTPTDLPAWVNVDKAIKNGFEVETRFDVGNALDWGFSLAPYVNYTRILKNEFIDLKTEVWTPVVDVSRSYLSWGMDLNHIEWDLRARFNVNTQEDRLLYNTDPAHDDHNRKVPGFSVASLSFSKGLFDIGDQGKVKLVGEIDNLFDRDYLVYDNKADKSPSGKVPLEYRMPGRSVFLGMAYEFN